MTVKVTCITNGKYMNADILESSTKRIKVVFVGGNQTLVLTRPESQGMFKGSFAGLEFESRGER